MSTQSVTRSMRREVNGLAYDTKHPLTGPQDDVDPRADLSVHATIALSDATWLLFSNCGQVGFSTIAPERFNVPAGVTVLFEVDHEGRLIMLSDVVGPKVHFGV